MHTIQPSLAFIDGLGAPEMMLVFVLVLILFGGQKLPEFARGLGKSIREFKKAAAGVEEEFKRALEEDERKTTTPQLAAPATASTYTDTAGPDAGVHSPVTADDVYTEPVDEHAAAVSETTPPAPAVTPAAPVTPIGAAAPTTPALSEPEQKILPPTQSAPAGNVAEAPKAPEPGTPTSPPPPAPAPQHPS